jgi:hypothetical protein
MFCVGLPLLSGGASGRQNKLIRRAKTRLLVAGLGVLFVLGAAVLALNALLSIKAGVYAELGKRIYHKTNPILFNTRIVIDLLAAAIVLLAACALIYAAFVEGRMTPRIDEYLAQRQSEIDRESKGS